MDAYHSTLPHHQHTQSSPGRCALGRPANARRMFLTSHDHSSVERLASPAATSGALPAPQEACRGVAVRVQAFVGLLHKMVHSGNADLSWAVPVAVISVSFTNRACSFGIWIKSRMHLSVMRHPVRPTHVRLGTLAR